jgi:phosphotriesterase-related protein
MAKTIQTIKGPIDSSELGATLTHEHIFVRNLELETNYPAPEWSLEDCVARARAGMLELRSLGYRSMVDLSVIGLGRDIEILKRVGEDLDFNILVATGYYSFNELPSFYHNHGPGLMIDGPEPLHDMFVRDIRDGIAGSGVKAAVIKIATDTPGFTKDVTRIFEAACRAQMDTGVPISTHTNAKLKGGLDQQAFFKSKGVDLSRTVIGHSGDSTDLNYLRQLMDAGSYIGMDRFGLTWFLSDEDRTETIVKLCELGYAERLTMSHDAAYFSVNSEPTYRAKALPDWTHTLIPKKIIPSLRKAGVTDEQINQMTVENPARIFAI